MIDARYKYSKNNKNNLPVLKIITGENWRLGGEDDYCVCLTNADVDAETAKEIEYWGRDGDHSCSIYFQNKYLNPHQYDGDPDDFEELEDYENDEIVEDEDEEYDEVGPWHFIGKNGYVIIGDLSSLIENMKDNNKIALKFENFSNENSQLGDITSINPLEFEKFGDWYDWYEKNRYPKDEDDCPIQPYNLGYLIFKVGDIRNSPTKGKNVCISCIAHSYDNYGYIY